MFKLIPLATSIGSPQVRTISQTPNLIELVFYFLEEKLVPVMLMVQGNLLKVELLGII